MIAINRHQRWLTAVVLSGGLLTGGLMAVPHGSAGQATATPSTGSSMQATPGTAGDQCDNTQDAGGENGDNGGTGQQDLAGTAEQEDSGSGDATDGESGADGTQGDNADEASATPGALTGGQDLLARATISLADATQAAQGAATGDLGAVELEEVNGTLVFRVEVGGQEVLIDAANGTVVSIEAGDQSENTGDGCSEGDAAEANAVPGTLVEGQDLASGATITVEQAITAAQAAATGDLGVVGLEDQNGTLVYTVKIGGQEVTVDATTGAVVSTESDQED